MLSDAEMATSPDPSSHSWGRNGRGTRRVTARSTTMATSTRSVSG